MKERAGKSNRRLAPFPEFRQRLLEPPVQPLRRPVPEQRIQRRELGLLRRETAFGEAADRIPFGHQPVHIGQIRGLVGAGQRQDNRIVQPHQSFAVVVLAVFPTLAFVGFRHGGDQRRHPHIADSLPASVASS